MKIPEKQQFPPWFNFAWDSINFQFFKTSLSLDQNQLGTQGLKSGSSYQSSPVLKLFFIDEKNQLSKSDSYLHLRASKDQSYSTKTCTLQICAHKICLMSTGGLTCFQIWNKCKFLRPYLFLFGFVLWPCLNCINPSRYGRQLIHLDCWFVLIHLYVYIYIYVYIIRTMSSNLCKYGGQLMCVRRWIMGTKPSAGLVERSNKLIVFGWPQNLPDIFIKQNSLFRVYEKPQ